MREKTLIDELKWHFYNAGFVDSNTLINDKNLVIPNGVFVMHNSFGLMAGLEISISGEELADVLMHQQDDMQSWIRKALVYLENKKGLIVDGYLLLILQQEPDTKMKKIIR